MYVDYVNRELKIKSLIKSSRLADRLRCQIFFRDDNNTILSLFFFRLNNSNSVDDIGWRHVLNDE